MTADAGMTVSRSTAYIAVFAAMTAAMDVIPTIPGFYSGIWDSWLFLISPIVGVLLGPYLGAISVGMGTFVGHVVYFRDPYELVFMLGAPVGAAVSGLVYRRRWRPAIAIYSGLLLGYFLTPISWILPLWGVWDILAGYTIALAFAVLVQRDWGPLTSLAGIRIRLVFSTVIGLESDILTRVFILIPGHTYWVFYGLTAEQLQLLWMGAGIVTPLKVAMAVTVAVTIGMTLVRHMGAQLARSRDNLILA